MVRSTNRLFSPAYMALFLGFFLLLFATVTGDDSLSGIANYLILGGIIIMFLRNIRGGKD